MNRQTIILDFDGVVHSYSSGWKGAAVIPDPPTPGAKEAIAKLRETYNVVIVSSRCHQEGGVESIADWLNNYNIEVDCVTSNKPPHVVVVDDRALRFNGDWDEVIQKIPEASVPWNKQDRAP